MEPKAHYECWSHVVPARLKKIRSMQPKDKAGSKVGKARLGNRRGGKIRGMKAGRQRQAKVNVATLVAKTNKKSNAA